MSRIETLSIVGFKSIRKLEKLQLNRLNVLIGANGAGKSNFIAYFRMLNELVEGRLQLWTSKQGGADRILSYGVKNTSRLESSIRFGINGYDLALESTADGSLVFSSEELFFDGPYYGISQPRLGSGHLESRLKDADLGSTPKKIAKFCYDAISDWQVYHFHDTSDTAGVKRYGSLHDNEFLRSDASNLAAFLYRLRDEDQRSYEKIRKTVRLAIPVFDDFVLKPRTLPTEEQQIRLLWTQRNNDYALWPSQLSDGSVRFICLVTALLQPKPPSTLLIDEPELGLHPYAIALLGALLRSASKRTQIIVSTQSVPLVNEFTIADLLVVDYRHGESIFSRYDEDEFSDWLEDFSVGELWVKNLLGGRPRS